MPKDQLGSCFCPVDLFSSPSLVTPRSHSSDSFGYVLCYWLGRTLPSITTHNILTQILHLPLRPAQVISATLLTSGHIKKNTHTLTYVCLCVSHCVCVLLHIYLMRLHICLYPGVCVCVWFYVPQHLCVNVSHWSGSVCFYVCVCMCACVCVCLCEVWIEQSCDQMGSVDQVTCL